MATNNPIAEKINNFNVYIGQSGSQKLAGIAGEITLPEIPYSTEEIAGAGLLGSYESPNVGHTGSISIEIPLRLLSADALDLAVGDQANLTLRAGTQYTDISNGGIVMQGLVINLRGPVKAINWGTAKVGGPMDATITVEVLYIKGTRDVEGSLFTLLELDKLNFVYIINGVDRLAQLRRYI